MTRQEEIRNAIDKIIPIFPSRNGRTYEQALMATGFEAGARWADEHPKEGLVDLSQVWHNAKEEPEKGKSIISIGSTGVSAYKWVDEWRCDWLDFAEWSELFRWAYVYDLLPREGE